MDAPGPPQVDAISPSVVKVNGVEVSSDASKPTVINININQPSPLASLIQAATSSWKGRESAKDGAQGPVAPKNGTNGPVAPFRGEQKVLGAVQIMIGLVCVSIAVMFCFVRRSRIFWTGSGFWTGIPFILVGAVSIVGEKRSGRRWLCAASLLNWVSLAVAIAGIVMISDDFSLYSWWRWNPEYFCNPKSDDYYGGYYYRNTTPEPVNYRMEECKEVLGNLMILFFAMRIMLMVVTCLSLCISLYSLGYGWKTLCCTFTKQEEEAVTVENDKERLIISPPPPYVEKLLKLETV